MARNAPTNGYFAEVGVYKGGSLKHLALCFPERQLFGFDSFEGLPLEQWSKLEVHAPGEFSYTSIESVTNFLNECNDRVQLFKRIFPGSATSVKDYNFSFVHIDTDFYLSVKACIEWFWPRLLTGGIMSIRRL